MSGYIDRVADAIAGILTREGLGYTQTKAVFKARAPEGRARRRRRGAAPRRG